MMQRTRRCHVTTAFLGVCLAGGLMAAEPGRDAKAPGPVRRAATGHVTNYEETKVGGYTLPDPLVFQNGEPVRTAKDWMLRRRPELLAAYESEVFGRVPAPPPATRCEVLATGEPVENGAGIRKHLRLHFGPDAAGAHADVVVYIPAAARGPVPVLLHIVFLRGLPASDASAAVAENEARRVGAWPWRGEIAPVAEVLARGYAYATFRYTDVQPDAANTRDQGVQGLAGGKGGTGPAPDEWGTISVWAWAASRVLDCLAQDRALDAGRVALIGHSRLGKTALWAGAQDPRFALVFASCSGEMGAALSRRDFGETVDDMAAVFPYWFAGNFQRYAGHWDRLPVDAHTLIALNAPRPVFLTGGTEDQWADPKGEFLAAVAAGPVYRLLGRKDLGRSVLPPADEPLVGGTLGWFYHAGPHAILPQDWEVFLDFADRHLQPKR